MNVSCKVTSRRFPTYSERKVVDKRVVRMGQHLNVMGRWYFTVGLMAATNYLAQRKPDKCRFRNVTCLANARLCSFVTIAGLRGIDKSAKSVQKPINSGKLKFRCPRRNKLNLIISRIDRIYSDSLIFTYYSIEK